MNTTAEVRLWGSTIGALTIDDSSPYASFEYDRSFIPSGIEVSPVAMPLSQKVYRFPELSLQSFNGLPGLLSDSLPDTFGNALIDVWLSRQGRTSESFNAVERLCYTGERGMGALEFRPVLSISPDYNETVHVEELVSLASEIMINRKNLSAHFSHTNHELNDDVLKQIIQLGTSAGGARAKAVISWNQSTNEVRSGQIHAGDGFSYWLIK